MKKRRKKSRPTKDLQGQTTSSPQQAPKEVERDGDSKAMATSDCRVDDESTMEGYDTEGYRQLQSSNESNLNDVIDSTDDKHPTSDKCTPSQSNETAGKNRKEPRGKPKPKPGEPTKSRKRGRPPKIRISGAEKTECVPLVEQVDRETEAEERCKKQCLSWSLEEQGRNFLISEANSYTEWSDNRRQSAVDTSIGTDSDSSRKDNNSSLQRRSPSYKLSENFGTFQQFKQSSFVQCTTKDKENNLTRNDVNAGNVIEIVCGPNRGLMYLSRLSLATGERCKTKCIHFNDRWWTPSEFQMTSGRGAAKDWKRTIRHGDKCLKALLESGTLKLNLCNKNACFCESCGRGYHPPNDDLTKMPSLTPMTVKERESDDKSFPHEEERKSRKRDKDNKLSKQRKARPAAEQKPLDVEGYRGLKEFTSYTDEFSRRLDNNPPPLHLLRNEVPPSFCQPTNGVNDSSKGDSFQVFDETFYQPSQLKDRHKSHYKGQTYENICDLSFKSIIDNQNLSGLAEIFSRQPPITDQTQLSDENNNKFWKEESANNPKSMLRAVVEELKKKKKKSLSSYPGQHQMSARKSESSEDSAMDLSLHEPHKKLSKRADVSMDFQKASPSSPSPQATFSFSSSPTSHVYGFNSSLFPQTYPHFNFPFYSPYIFMGFPLHPIMSHHPSLSRPGFQTNFPSSTHPFPFEFARHHAVDPLLNKESTNSRESSDLEFSSKTACLPTNLEIDEENFKTEDKFYGKTEKAVKNFRDDSPGRSKSSHFPKSEKDKKDAGYASVLDFSLKSSKDNLDTEENGHLEVLDLSKNSHIR